MQEDKLSPPEKKVGQRSRVPFILGGLGALLLVLVFMKGNDWRVAVDALASQEKVETDEFAEAYAKWGTWWGALANGVILLGLAGTHRWWSKDGAANETVGTKTSAPKWAWLALGVILALAGWLRWERADLSLYNDEAHTFRRYVAGTHRVDKKGELKWREVSWLKTLFFNQAGNNTVPNALVERLSYETWLKLTKSPAGTMNERALRLPVILASLGSIFFLWLVARRFGSIHSALAVALLAAVHFWMVRYGNEARGYGMNMLAICAMFYFLVRALEGNRWKWWVGFGLMQFLCLWSFSGAIYFIALFNGILLLERGLKVWKRGSSAATLWRPVIGMTVGGMAAIQMMLPTTAQLLLILKKFNSFRGEMELPWWKEVAALFASGLHWGTTDDAAHEAMLPELPMYGGLVVVVLLLLGIGCWRLVSASFWERLLCLSGLAAVPLSWFIMSQKGIYLHPWYVIFALQGTILLLALRKPAGSNSARWPAVVHWGLIAVLAAYWLAINYQNRDVCREDIRGAHEVIRDGTPGSDKRLLGVLISDMDVYDKHAVLVKSMADLDALIAKAKSENRELWINYARRQVIASDMPGVLPRLEGGSEFELVKKFTGMDESQFSQYVVKWTGK